MSENSISRKDFLKGMGLAMGAAFLTKLSGATAFSGQKPDLSDEKEEFIEKYTAWLEEFDQFVEFRKKEDITTANSHRLIKLTEQAESFRPQLEKYMEDPEFASYFTHVSKKITDKI